MKIYTISGYNEVGKNMTVVDLGDDAIIIDAGAHIPALIELQEENEFRKGPYTEKELKKAGAIPDDSILDKKDIRKKVRAILLGHAHLDHIGAVPYIGYRYKAPVVGTPFTTAVLKRILQDEGIKIPNKIKNVDPNASYTIKGKKRNYRVDFINTTHSTPQTAMIAIHTPEGVILYANDFKLDKTPVLGLPPNYKALKELGKKGVKALIVDALYSGSERKTHSEKIARAMVEESLLTINNQDSAIFVSTFSSHVARLKSIVEYSKQMKRDVYFIGRSLKKYTLAAKDAGVCPFFKDIKQIGSYRNQVESILRKVEKNRKKSLVVCTGHQGEAGSIMDRLATKKLPFKFKQNDNVVFSSKTIPTPINIAQKGNMDKKLKKLGVRIFDNVHVSGHGGREDLRDLISMVNPENIIPSHGPLEKVTPMVELAREMGFKANKGCHIMQDGQMIEFK